MKPVLYSIILMIALSLHGNNCFAQDTNKPFKPIKRYTPLPLTPRFPGGRDSLAAFIVKSTHYPRSAQKHGIKGVIQVNFLVTKEGELKNIHVLHPLGYGCDKEAIRVVKLMPKWLPAMMGREPMELEYHVEIPFGVEYPKPNYP